VSRVSLGLREMASLLSGSRPISSATAEDAAREVESLRSALQEIVDCNYYTGGIAERALISR
jgi:hypothetical protein